MEEGKEGMRNKVTFEWQSKERIWNAEDSRDISSKERICILGNMEEKFEKWSITVATQNKNNCNI